MISMQNIIDEQLQQLEKDYQELQEWYNKYKEKELEKKKKKENDGQ